MCYWSLCGCGCCVGGVGIFWANSFCVQSTLGVKSITLFAPSPSSPPSPYHSCRCGRCTACVYLHPSLTPPEGSIFLSVCGERRREDLCGRYVRGSSLSSPDLDSSSVVSRQASMTLGKPGVSLSFDSRLFRPIISLWAGQTQTRQHLVCKGVKGFKSKLGRPAAVGV